MPQARWRKQMELGYEPLDNEHKEFFEVVQKSTEASQVGDFATMEWVFDKAYDYARDHFSHEEDIMERIHFPDIEAHMRAHQIFIKNISELRQQYEVASSEEDKGKIAVKTANFLNVWLLGHILSRDKVYKPYLVRLRNLPPRMNYDGKVLEEGQ
ncbi:MAG: hemerythrin family protein [Alphaproteobacteria bacterium]|nr:hemerythrin family protein [Alphaproteobacteria bacterium]